MILCSWARSWGQGRRPPILPSVLFLFLSVCCPLCLVMLSAGETQDGFLEEEALLHTQLLWTLPVLPLLFFFYENKKRGVPLVAQMVRHLPVMQAEPGLIPGLKRFSGEGNSFPLQYCCLENPVDRGTWQTIVYRVAESRT